MEEYPSNSHKSREREKENSTPEKQVNKVITGEVKTAKKGFFRKLLGMFFSDDVGDIKTHVVLDIILPGIKRIISDSVDLALNGETGRKRTGTPYVGNYHGGYNNQNDKDRARFNIHDLYEVDDIILDTYGDCELVLDDMNGLIRKYGVVSVSDLYDMLGQPSKSHTDCKYGWNSLRTARIVPVRGGYMLKLPRVVPLN